MKHYYKSSGLQMFFTGAAIAVMFIIILCADSLIEFVLRGGAAACNSLRTTT